MSNLKIFLFDVEEDAAVQSIVEESTTVESQNSFLVNKEEGAAV